jgi:16S rRNA (adenine1518-N6/adenine1519-N6)-dimethyltransferase
VNALRGLSSSVHSRERSRDAHLFTLLDLFQRVKTEPLGYSRPTLFLLHFRRMARQRLGQHFLADADWREQIARATGVSQHSTLARPSAAEALYCWVEVGAGHGEMTEYLASTGAPVYAVELDTMLVGKLQRLTKQFSNLTVVPGDVLETDLSALAAGRRIRLYGNLPYYITSPILHHFFTFADLIDEIHIIIQEEVAQRLTAKPETKQFGYLSVATQLYTRPEFVLRIPRSAFSPPPEVGSALVTLRLPGERANLAIPGEEAFLDFVKLCFSKKRKTLINNLRSLAEPDVVREALSAQGLRLDARAEQLSVAQFAVLRDSLAPSL